MNTPTNTGHGKQLLSDAELLARLVSFDSTSRNSNLAIAAMIADYLDRPGIRVEHNPSADGDKTNLVVTVGPQVDGATRAGLVLSGHMDVVPADEPDWHSDPFELTETDDTYVGRGACDMKGFVALAVNTAARAASAKLAHPLALVLTYDEEVGTLGAHRFVETWPAERPLPRAAIIGEPTSLVAVRMHKGHAQMHLLIHGRSAHSGYPHLGHSAIEPAARAISALAELRRQLAGEICPHRELFPQTPYVALNVGKVEGGAAINVVPDHCQVDFGFRVLPGMDSTLIADRTRQVLAEALDGEDYELLAGNEAPSMLLAEDQPIYREVCELTGQSETCSASYATDAGWLQQAGFDCLIFGPGSIEVAHKPNEWMPKDEYHRASDLLGKLSERFCLQ